MRTKLGHLLITVIISLIFVFSFTSRVFSAQYFTTTSTGSVYTDSATTGNLSASTTGGGYISVAATGTSGGGLILDTSTPDYTHTSTRLDSFAGDDLNVDSRYNTFTGYLAQKASYRQSYKMRQ